MVSITMGKNLTLDLDCISNATLHVDAAMGTNIYQAKRHAAILCLELPVLLTFNGDVYRFDPVTLTGNAPEADYVRQDQDSDDLVELKGVTHV